MGQVAKGARFNHYLLNTVCFLLGLKETHGYIFELFVKG